MRQGDDLFFAPDIRFVEVDLACDAFPDQYRARIDGFYLDPTRLCLERRHAFAAGVLLVSTIDFMAGLHHSAESLARRRVGTDFRRFAQSELESFRSSDLAQRVYDEFRNGLAHEARIKNAGEFSFDWAETVRLSDGRLCINPASLLREVECALDRQIIELHRDKATRETAANRLRVLFAREFGIVQEEAPPPRRARSSRLSHR